MLSLFKSKQNADSIFISIASFCDDDLVNTIENVIENAAKPANLFFCICLQDDWDKYETFPFKDNTQFKIIFIPKEESKGC